MRMTYSRAVDALAITLNRRPANPVKTREVAPGVHLDFDAKGRLVGLELLEASHHMTPGDLASIEEPGRELTLREAAQHSGLTAATLRVLLNAGDRLKGRKKGRDWLVSQSALDQYLASRSSSGRPAASAKGRRRRPAITLEV